jgi:hypothetical protein
MVLLMITVWYPHDKSMDVAKKYIELNKKYPPDRSIAKTLVIGVTASKEGIKVIALASVVKGKFEEALALQSTFQREFSQGIEGYKYKIETLMDITEAYATVDMKAPEDR